MKGKIRKGFLTGTVFSEEDKPSNTSVNESPGENEHIGEVLPSPEDAMAEKGVPQRRGGLGFRFAFFDICIIKAP